MRVLALLTDGFGVNGGIARYNQALMTAIGQCAGVSEVAVLPRYGGVGVSSPERIVQLEPRAGRLSWSTRAIAMVARRRFDLLFCGHLNALPLARALAMTWRIPLWAQAHGIEAWEPRGAVTRKGIQSATLVTAVSRYTRRRLLDWTDIPPERVRVLPNTFTTNFVPRARRADLAARHGVAGKSIVLTVGRLAAAERYKGHDRIIQVLRAVRARVPEAVYMIVGSGDDLPRLRRLAEDNQVGDAVLFVRDVSPDELPDYYALADVFAMPSTGEGFGIVFLEAAASGLPVVGGKHDGSVDALADGSIGRIVDVHDPEVLVRNLIEFLSEPARVAPERVDRFAFAHFARHVECLIQETIGR